MNLILSIPTGLGRIVGSGWVFFAATLCLAVGAPGVAHAAPERGDVAASDISEVTIQASHMGWDSSKTNFMLLQSNTMFAAGNHRVPEAVVSKLLATILEPPRTQIDPDNLGLTPA